MILVVGSTGYLGSSACFKLAATGKAVAGLARDPSSHKAQALAAAGVRLVVGDLKNPASVEAALAGAQTVICTANSMLSRREGDSIETVDHLGVQTLISAAEKASARDFIFVSFDTAGENHPLALAKRAAEMRLQHSTLNWTILQPACFCETWLSPAVGFDVRAGKVRIYGEGDKPVHYISLNDVANAIVACVANAMASRQIFRFGGPGAPSQLAAVHFFEQASGRKFAIERMSISDLNAARAAATDPVSISFLGLCHQVAAGFTVDADWQARLGVQALPLEEWVRQRWLLQRSNRGV